MIQPKGKIQFLIVALVISSNITLSLAYQGGKDNGDIYVINNSDTSVDSSTNNDEQSPGIDFDAIMEICNASFSIPMDYLVQFNNTGGLPNVIDKTGPCYIRCFYEKSGFIENWTLNGEKIRQYMWPATGDSIEVCQEEGKSEINACLRTYAIAKCLMIRSLVDARNKPMV